MRKRAVPALSVLAFVCLTMILASVPVAADTPHLQLTVYFSPSCSSCHVAREEILPPIIEQYEGVLDVAYVDMTETAGLAELEAAEARIGTRAKYLPVLVLGSNSDHEEIISTDNLYDIGNVLVTAIEARISPPPDSAEVTSAPPTTSSATAAATATPVTLASATPAASPTVVPATAAPSSGAAIRVAYVEKEGCETCQRALVVLETMQKEWPAIEITPFSNMHDAAIIEAMGEKLGLPEEQRLIAPSVYIGNDAVVGDDITGDRLREVLSRYASTGAPAFWEALDTGSGGQSILSRFESMGPFAVVLAALIDGINPCAFATIIFFVSYLAISRRGRGELIRIGLAFTAGVFLTYLAVGLGAMSLLKLANAVHILGTILYSLMALSCFVLAAFSIKDYFLARRGKLQEMSLNLPSAVRSRIHKRIRSGSKAFAGAAFVSGLVVSLLELACTGQVYLPTISFVISIPSMRASAIAYLVLYNVVFIVPLLIVLILAAYGLSAQRLRGWFEQNAARTKLGMAVLFLILGLLLLTQVLPL